MKKVAQNQNKIGFSISDILSNKKNTHSYNSDIFAGDSEIYEDYNQALQECKEFRFNISLGSDIEYASNKTDISKMYENRLVMDYITTTNEISVFKYTFSKSMYKGEVQKRAYCQALTLNGFFWLLNKAYETMDLDITMLEIYELIFHKYNVKIGFKDLLSLSVLDKNRLVTELDNGSEKLIITFRDNGFISKLEIKSSEQITAQKISSDFEDDFEDIKMVAKKETIIESDF